MNKDNILNLISIERENQDLKFNEQNHHILQWFSIIDEERGEMSKEWNEFTFDNDENHLIYLFYESIQTLASIVAMLEYLIRSKIIDFDSIKIHFHDLEKSPFIASGT